MAPALRLAILADIHGNLPALEAVRADLNQMAPDAVYLLGDLVNRCPWNNEVMALIEDEAWPSIQGNHDLVISRIGTPHNRPPFDQRARFPVLHWTRDQLRDEYVGRLGALPRDRVLAFDGAPALHLFHGVPDNPSVGIYPETGDDEIARTFAPFAEPLIVCGHTHRPLDRRWGQRRLLNPGSVGLPYNGDPRAQYLVLDAEPEGGSRAWRARFRQVDYDRSAIPVAFAESGMLAEGGPLARLYLRTVLDGLPWASDFGHWLKDQPEGLRSAPARAVELYLTRHGPQNWSFQPTPL